MLHKDVIVLKTDKLPLYQLYASSSTVELKNFKVQIISYFCI